MLGSLGSCADSSAISRRTPAAVLTLYAFLFINLAHSLLSWRLCSLKVKQYQAVGPSLAIQHISALRKTETEYWGCSRLKMALKAPLSRFTDIAALSNTVILKYRHVWKNVLDVHCWQDTGWCEDSPAGGCVDCPNTCLRTRHSECQDTHFPVK